MEFIKIILTSLLSVVALFFIAKIMGHKQLAQLDFFDYITGITIGSIAAELAIDLETPWKALVAMLIYGAVSVTLNMITHKFPKTRKFINGTPTIVMNDGKIFRKNLKKAKLDLSEFMVLCREQGYFDMNDIKTAIFEQNGKLTVFPVSTSRPLTAYDINLKVKPEHISTELIMDGRIMGENLKRRGLDVSWLEKQIRALGYHGTKEVFLALCDESNKLTVFGFD
ncbi:MAG: DUF421 domain-containing protein [Clostridia bacterium]|nr:DUF421 domain-containing protein [Clostridia bacterium]